MIFPMNGRTILYALSGRGITAAELASAIAISTEEAQRMLTDREGCFSARQSKAVERLAGVPIATLGIEGLYRMRHDSPEALADLDTSVEVFPDIEPSLAAARARRLAMTKTARKAPRVPSRS